MRVHEQGRTSAYRIRYILPALVIRDPMLVGPAVFCTNAHLSRYDIRPHGDAKSAQTIADNLRPAYGQPLGQLGLMLVPESDVPALERRGVPRMCRDALALACITGGTAQNFQFGNGHLVHNADYFDTLPIQFHDSGFLVCRPGYLGNFTHGVGDCQPSLPAYLPNPDAADFQIDRLLLGDLSRAISAYRRGTRRPALRQVFRAVALSLHATRIMAETDSTYFDLGVRITSWVSAFETLVHPGKGRVGIKQVLELIRQIRWADATPSRRRRLRPRCPPLARKRYVLRRSNLSSVRDNVACHLYWRLYNLRNDVAHGNPIRRRAFAARLGQHSGARIDEIMPLLFRECVRERLRQIGIRRRISDGPTHLRAADECVCELLYSYDYHESMKRILLGCDHNC